MKKILIFVTHGLGEFDVVFPLIARVKRDERCSFTIIITVRKIFRQFNESDFYRYCAGKLGVTILFCQFPNKFDHGFKLVRKYIRSRTLVGLVYNCYLIFKALLIYRHLAKSDCFMHEVTNQWSTTKVMYWLKGRQIFSYMHGHGITTDTVFKHKVRRAQDVIYLNFHEHNRSAVEQMGFPNQIIIGYPKLSRDWENLVRSYHPNSPIGANSVVIFTRPINKVYMTEENYHALLFSSFKAIRNILGHVLIVIKMHPREDERVGARIMREIGFDENTLVSKEHAAVLSRDALATITFWGSTVFDGFSMNKPTIEYFIEGPGFRKSEPCGSAYKKAGFHSVSNQAQLESILRDVARGTYKESVTLQGLRETEANSAFWNTLPRQLCC